ncbi:MAG TPA: penicillin acylase family protein [Terriglobales bacterium]|jgi:penicillin amidase
MQIDSPPPLRGLRFALDILIAVLLLFAVLCGLLYWYVRSSQPGLDGRQPLAGLVAPVTVTRDQLGIPHITAANLHDLLFAQGYAMAQDRLWQMDLLRRLGEGRLAEIFGPQAVDFDRKNRQLGLGRVADAEAARLDPGDRALLQAFSAGVNSYITSRGRRLPLEFWLLRYNPEPWQPRDSLAMAAYMFQVLGSGYEEKLSRESITAQLGPTLAAELYPTLSPWDLVPGVPVITPPRVPRFTTLPVFAAPTVAPAPLQGGSNDWVLSGSRSFNGKPILANDPHLPFQVPGLWWAAQLTAPGVNVAGVALAGVPGIIIGHNDSIAWGVTNTGADVQDLYRNDPVIDHWHEQILVKGGSPVSFDIPVTRHGPVIAHDAGGTLALAWSLYTPGALQSVHVFLALDHAQNFAQFEQALSGFPGPAQNFVYADVQGHIAYQCAGWVPVRHGFDGSVPVDAADPRFEWHGFVPFPQLPHSLDPPAGLLATANGRVTPSDYPYTITTNWGAPNRTRRIQQLLDALPRWNASAMGRVQQDVISEQDRDFAQAIVAAGVAARARGVVLPASTLQALALLRGFRGAMGHTSLAPTLAFQTRHEFLHRILAAKLGEALAREYDHHESTVFEQWLLAAHPPQWLPSGQTWDDLLLDSLANVVGEFTLQPAQLHWGRFETLRVPHPVFSHLPLVRDYADLGPVEINGSPLTVKQARNTWLGDPSDLGPSMRFVADLGDWDRSTLNLVAGESGQIFNPHYRDQFLPYLRGLALPLWFTPAAVARHRAHQLLLTP